MVAAWLGLTPWAWRVLVVVLWAAGGLALGPVALVGLWATLTVTH